jgi:WD40 repeat protein
LDDAKRFILRNRYIADIAPLQIYVSGLLFAPQNALIRRIFDREIPSWIHHWPTVEETWGPDLQTLEGHSDKVGSVAFSPNSQLLASGSYDGTIKV